MKAKKFTKYKLLVMDVDGTLTDGKIYMAEQGELFKAFDVKDGYGIKTILPQLGIESAIITGRKSCIIDMRAQELGIDYVYQGQKNKVECLHKLVKDIGISWGETIYIGDDLNDLTCIERINEAGGMTACPADATSEIKEVALYICKNNSGNGAVREVIDLLRRQKNE